MPHGLTPRYDPAFGSRSGASAGLSARGLVLAQVCQEVLDGLGAIERAELAGIDHPVAAARFAWRLRGAVALWGVVAQVL